MPTLECPTCRRRFAYRELSEIPHRPFCSRRCQLIDLGKWLNEEYRVSEEIPPDELPEQADSPAPPRSDPLDRAER